LTEPLPDLVAVTRRRAEADTGLVLDLARQLIRIPSRAAEDPYGPVLSLLEKWFADHDLHTRQLITPSGDVVGIVCDVTGSRPGPHYVLDACIDTAGFGDPDAWTYTPTSAYIADGWLYGRGAADSKTAAAIFAHIAATLAERPDHLAGRLTVLLDADEHTGGFGGATAYFTQLEAQPVTGVMIGYPGDRHIIVGGRGVWRATITIHGIAGHTGGSHPGTNAIEKAADLITRLTTADHDLAAAPVDPAFPLRPKITITAIHAGTGYTVTPDTATLNLDIRTTPIFTTDHASALATTTLGALDVDWPHTPVSRLHPCLNWPHYRLPDHAPVVTALLAAAKAAGYTVTPKIAGPSNIGCYLAGLAIPATAGFGLTHHGLHATDERIHIPSITTTHHAYYLALYNLLRAPTHLLQADTYA